MKKMFIVLIVGMLASSSLAFSQGQCVVLDVPYIHQVLDMNQSVFLGHNACGPTSAMMILNYYGLLPPNTSGYPGYYVYTGYTGYMDYSGKNYNGDNPPDETARDWNPSSSTNPHPHLVPGAHGYIVDEYPPDWKANPDKVRNFLINHGLDISNWIESNPMSTIQTEINAGRPLIGHIKAYNKFGHYLVIVGVDGPNEVVVHDPYGDANGPEADWDGSSRAPNVIYNISTVHLDRVITIKPGSRLVGWRLADRTTNQKFVDCFNRLGGVNVVGWIHNDGAGGYLHNWVPWRYLCQNFLNDGGGESIIMYDPGDGSLGIPPAAQAYLVSGLTWEYYRYGYDGHYGPDIRLPNGKTLGCPMSDKANGIQYFGVSGQRTGYYKEGLKAFQPAKAAEGEPVKTSETYVPAVDLYQLDGALVGTYYLAGELSALTLTAEPMSQNHNALAWLGGPLASSYRVLADGTEIATTPLKTWVEVNLLPGTTRKYQVIALAEDSTVLASSNEVVVVGPGQAGSFLLQGAADGFDYIYLTWNNTQYPAAPFYWVYRDGVRIAKLASGFSRWHDYPLEPSHTYTYQLAAVTGSELVLGWSNEVLVTTEAAPPPPSQPEPAPTSITICLDQTVWQVLTSSEDTGNYVSATVLDQYGNEMAGQRVLFIDDNFFPDYVFTVSGDNGSCDAWNIGQAQVWAELYDNREIRSERINVSVVEFLPENPPPPVILPEATGFTITDGLRRNNYSARIFAGQGLTLEGGIRNISGQPITFIGPAVLIFDASTNGWLGTGYDYSVIPKTWAPGQELGPAYCFGGGAASSPGGFYLALGVQIGNDWHIVSQAENGGQSKFHFLALDPADVKAEIAPFSFGLPASPENRITTSDDCLVRVWAENSGDIPSNPFEVTVSQGGQCQSGIIPALTQGSRKRLDFNFGKLPADNYIVDLFLDSGSAIAEYDESNNLASIIVEVVPAPRPDLAMVSLAPAKPEFVGELAEFDISMSNQGLAPSVPCQFSLSLSDGTPLGTAEIPGLEVGEFYNFSLICESFLPDGISLISGQADSTGIVEETDEGNNSLSCEVRSSSLALPLLHIPFGCRGKEKPGEGE